MGLGTGFNFLLTNFVKMRVDAAVVTTMRLVLRDGTKSSKL
jgi:hypothetical protein